MIVNKKGAIAWTYFVIIVLLVGLVVLMVLLSTENAISDLVSGINQGLSGGINA
ncbi:MAG: hypothetical protein GOV02_00965 [Candidatus Aenigmarchaeota archaeon]|nr:hypothetical protein [Candidatus Aenigmarchaeota archaeon]